MSIIDKPNKNLNPLIWGKDEKLLPKVKNEILSKLTTLIPEKLILQVWFIGSNAGLQYNNTSDIDVSVVIDVSSDLDGKEARKYWHNIFKNHNAKNNYLTNTFHPINFFMMSRPKERIDWGDETYGVYLIKDFITGEEDVWEKPYLSFDKIRDPKDFFGTEAYNYAGHLSKTIEESLNDIYDKFDKYKETAVRDRLREIEKDIEDLVVVYKEIDSDRKLQYYHGWGIPKRSFKNFIYKYLERRGLIKILEKLKNRV
jgi:predicted nucleotidyltransferase